MFSKTLIGGLIVISALAIEMAPSYLFAQSASLPQVGWQQASTEMTEGAPVQLIAIFAFRTVDGTRVSEGQLRIPYTTSGNATPDVDFRLDPLGAIEFLDGRDHAGLRIAIIDDDQHEPAPDTLFVHLTPGAGYTLDPARTTLRVVLRDNDPAGNPVPAITSVTRDASVKGKAVALVVGGSGFIESSTVRIGGEAVATTFVSATELRADVSKKFANAARDETVAVTVFNSAPGGGESAPHAFTFTR